MKKTMVLLLAGIFVLLVFSSCKEKTKQELPDKVGMYYFYEEICGSCDGTEEINAIVQEKLKPVSDAYPYTLYRYNIYNGDGKKAYDDICEEMGLDKAYLEIPLLIAGGRVFQGHESISKNIAEAYLTAGEDLFVNEIVYNPAHKKTGKQLFSDYNIPKNSVTAVYFYRITCDECNETKPVINALPEEIVVDGKKYDVNLIYINTRAQNNDERISAFFDSYNLPDEDRMVPIVFFANGYLAGYENISNGIDNALTENAGVAFEFPEVS